MLIRTLYDPTCCVCGTNHYEGVFEWYFWGYSKTFLDFDDKPYYLCRPACYDKFNLAPAAYRPLAYTLRY